MTNSALNYPPLSLRLFGPLTAAVGGQPLPKMRSKKESWLLALLALHAHAPLERFWLAGTLWPDAAGDEAALYNLRRSLRALREALGPEAARLLSPTPRSLRLDLDGADCDAAAFDAAVRRGDLASLAEAAALYRGPLLLDCREEWALAEREARERAVLAALETLAEDARTHGDFAAAAAHLKRVLEIDPLRETAVRALMEVHAGQNSHAAATDTYRAFRQRLHGELNAEPDPSTIALYRRLRAAVRQAARSPHAPAPPPTRPAGPRSSLPVPLSTLIGREREIEAVAAHLDEARLVTLTGTGGVGKTRLALAAAHALAAEFEDGAWFADLAPLADPKLMVQAVLGALGAREAPGRSPSDALSEFLRSRRLLLVLDNCEHLVSACSHLAQALLPLCSGLHVLATSREALGVPGEVVWRVPSLSVSGPEADAVQLFLARAKGVRPGWTPSGPEAHAVAEICRRLDGIPLAIEMAAARTRALPVESVAARLGQAFRLLSGPGGAGAVPRQQTLRATLDWSWDLLPEWEKALLSRVSVFAGGWDLDAAEAVCTDAGADEWAIPDGLTSLVDKSLVVYTPEDEEARYRLLETVRQYAGEKRPRGEETEAKHAAYFLALAEEAEPELTKEDQAGWLTRLETEHDNVRAALAWGLAEPSSAETGLRLVGALERFWVVRGHLFEGRQWLDKAFAQTEPQDSSQGSSQYSSAVRAKALNCLGKIAYSQSDYQVSTQAHLESLALRRQMNSRAGVATSLNNLGNNAWAQGHFQEARRLYEECLEIRRELEDRQGIATVLIGLANVEFYTGHPSAAVTLHRESLALRRETNDLYGVANVLQNLGNIAQAQASYGEAKALTEECLALRRRLEDKSGTAAALNNLANAVSRLGDERAAAALHQESLTLNRELGDLQGIAHSLHNLGRIASRQGNYPDALGLHRDSLRLLVQIKDRYGAVHSLEGFAEADAGLNRWRRTARLLGAAAALRASLGSPADPDDQAEQDRTAAAARAALGADAFAATWAAGQAMDWEQAADDALGDGD